MQKDAAEGAVFLLDSPYPADEVWDHLPQPVQQTIIDRNISFYVIDAHRVARDAGMGKRINTIMQACFFALSGVLPRDEAIASIKKAIEKTYKSKGQDVIDKNFAAVDAALDHLHEVKVPESSEQYASTATMWCQQVHRSSCREVTAQMMRGHGDELPVSADADRRHLSQCDGPMGKRQCFRSIPMWEPDLCIQCGNCAFVCPHSVIRAKFYHESRAGQGTGKLSVSTDQCHAGFPETRYSLQVYLEDCTGCTLCVDACPVKSPDDPEIRAINMTDKAPLMEQGKANIELLRDAGVQRSRRGRVFVGARCAVSAAVVRVPGRLCRLRRDALRQAAVAAVWPAFAGRQCHRLLVDLRRQSADHALEQERGGQRAGLVEFAVRRQCRVRSRHAHRGRSSHGDCQANGHGAGIRHR